MVKTRIIPDSLPTWGDSTPERLEERKRLLQFQEKCLFTSLPKHFPTFSFAKLFYPSTGVDADFFDAVFHDPERIDLIYGDVSKKGDDALFLSLHVKERIPKENIYTDTDRLLGNDLPSLTEIVQQMEKLSMEELIAQGSFVQLCYLRIDLVKKKLSLLNRGAPPIFHQRRAGELFLLQTEHPPLSCKSMEGAEKEEEGDIESGDRIFMASDGLILATNERGEPFGLERVAKLIEEGRGQTIEEMIIEAERRLKPFLKDDLPNDLFFLGIEVVGEGEAIERIGLTQVEELSLSFGEIFKIEQEIGLWISGEKRFRWTSREVFQLKLVTHKLTLELLKLVRERGLDSPLNVEKGEIENGLTITYVYKGPPFHLQEIKDQTDFGFALSVVQKNVDSIKYGERSGGYSFIEITKLHA